MEHVRLDNSQQICFNFKYFSNVQNHLKPDERTLIASDGIGWIECTVYLSLDSYVNSRPIRSVFNCSVLFLIQVSPCSLWLFSCFCSTPLLQRLARNQDYRCRRRRGHQLSHQAQEQLVLLLAHVGFHLQNVRLAEGVSWLILDFLPLIFRARASVVGFGGRSHVVQSSTVQEKVLMVCVEFPISLRFALLGRLVGTVGPLQNVPRSVLRNVW